MLRLQGKNRWHLLMIKVCRERLCVPGQMWCFLPPRRLGQSGSWMQEKMLPCILFCLLIVFVFSLCLCLSWFSSSMLAGRLGQSQKLGGGKLWPCLKTFLDLGFVTLSSHTVANSNFSFPTCLKIFLIKLFLVIFTKHSGLRWFRSRPYGIWTVALELLTSLI